MVGQRLVVVVAALAFTCLLANVATAQQQSPLCGNWLSTCKPLLSEEGLGADPYSEAVVFILDGQANGVLSIIRNVYNGGCIGGNETLTSEAIGVWADQGASTLNNHSKNLVWTITSVIVTPDSQSDVDILNQNCPCGDAWVAGTPRTLTSCDPTECTNTEFIDGVGGFVIGDRSFGTVEYHDDGISLSMTGPTQASWNQPPVVNVTYNGAACEVVPGGFKQIAGVWDSKCMPIQAPTDPKGEAIRGVKHEFQYDGPMDTEFKAGIFVGTRRFYTDIACADATEVFNVIETGTFTQTLELAPSYLRDAAKFSPNLIITPVAKGSDDYLKGLCDCGKKWKVGQSTTLTGCEGTCSLWWDPNSNAGLPLYGSIATYEYSIDGDMNDTTTSIRLSQFAPTAGVSNFQPENLELEYSKNLPGRIYSKDFCGVFAQPCMSKTTYGVQRDQFYTVNLTVSDDLESGLFTRTLSTYPYGSACDADATMTVVDQGYWTNTGPSPILTGSYDFSAYIPSILVTVNDKDLVNFLNDPSTGCPCGGEWERKKSRTITTCEAGTCIQPELLFGMRGTDLSGFATIQRSDANLRLGDLEPTPDAFTAPGALGLNDLTYGNLGHECSKPVMSKEVPCGEWGQPCQQEINTTAANDFHTSFTLYNDNRYKKELVLYNSGKGCSGSETILVVTQEGQAVFDSSVTTNQIEEGQAIELIPDWINVLPVTEGMAIDLNQNCKCMLGTSWSKMNPINFTRPCLQCDVATWMHQPIGVSSYGVLQRQSGTFRMTNLNKDKAAGYSATLTQADFQYFLRNDVCAPRYPKKSGGGGLDTGGILLLIFFFSLFGYFAIGLGYNYKTTNTFTIPHAQFWHGLPGLIADGTRFSLCQCCGMVGSRRPYKPVDYDTAGYGSL